MPLQFRRGTAAERAASTDTPAAGEPWYTTDNNRLYVGDGATVGGVEVGVSANIEQLNNVFTITEATATITNYTVQTNVATVTTSDVHQYYVGLIVDISDSATAILNGTHTITAVPNTTSFSFDLTTANVASTATNGFIVPQVPTNDILAWDQADGRWENIDIDTLLDPVIAATTIGGLSDVSNTYDDDTTIANPAIGNVLRYGYDGNWSEQRAGLAVDNSTKQTYIGVDWTIDRDTAYTANAALFQDINNTGTLVSASGTIDRPPYGDGLVDDGFANFRFTTASIDSTDFTADFWLWRDSASAVSACCSFRQNADINIEFRYDGTNFSLRSESEEDGSAYRPIAQTVRLWIIDDLDDQWVHFVVTRRGSAFRAWVNGTDEGAGAPPAGSTDPDNWDFQFADVDRFNPIAGDDNGHALGPFFLDIGHSWYDPAGGDITSPIERVDFYNKKSGVNVQELDNVDDIETPAHGSYLTYDNVYEKWMVNKPLYAKYRFMLAAAPTGAVASSAIIGQAAALGAWEEMTFANRANTGNDGPEETFDPTLTTLTVAAGGFGGFPPGVYRIDITAEITLDNLAADSYISHNLTINPFVDGVNNDVPSLTNGFVFTTNGTAPGAAVTQTIAFSHTVHLHSETVAENTVQFDLEANQSDEYYVSDATVVFTKIG